MQVIAHNFRQFWTIFATPRSVDLLSGYHLCCLPPSLLSTPTSCIYSFFSFHRSIDTRVADLVFSSQHVHSTFDQRHASTNVIEDDDTSPSAISELDSDRLTHSGGDDNASSNSTLNTPTITTPKSPRIRRQLAGRILLGGSNIKRMECLKSRLLSSITARGRLTVTNVV